MWPVAAGAPAGPGGAWKIGIGSGANRDFVMGLGASGYVDYTSEDVEKSVSDVDVALLDPRQLGAALRVRRGELTAQVEQLCLDAPDDRDEMGPGGR